MFEKIKQIGKEVVSKLLSKVSTDLILKVKSNFLVTFWKELTEWLQIVIKHLKERNLNATLEGTKVFLKKVGRKFERIAEHYSKMKDSDKWLKTTTINEELLEEDDIPENLRKKSPIEGTDIIDITEEYEEQLRLAN